jgi:L-fuconolactonase
VKIDAHHHFWQLSRAADYPWLSPSLASLNRDYGPDDLRPLLARQGIEGTILVQSSPTLAETRTLLLTAEAQGFVKGVVSWCEFTDPAAPLAIAELAKSPWLRGL